MSTKNPSARSARSARDAGFTLVELLAVISILVVLGGLGVLGISRLMRGSDDKVMATMLMELSAKLTAYERRAGNGDFPPTLLDPSSFPGVGASTNNSNCGIESVVICLGRANSQGAVGIEELAGGNENFDNYDQDRTEKGLTVLGPGVKDLFEIIDRWGTPIAYFHWRDYAQVESRDLGRITTGDQDWRVTPWKNPKTGGYYERQGFQLISAGQDLEFNTEDDITNFER